MAKEQLFEIEVQGKIIKAHQKFLATRAWWQNVFTRRWQRLDTTDPRYASVDRLTPEAAKTLNKKISLLLEEGATIVLAEDQAYHILRPDRNLLIQVKRGQAAQIMTFPTAVPAFHGNLRLEISVGRTMNLGFINVTCGQISYPINFDSSDPSSSPTLFALSNNALNPKPTLLFGRFTSAMLTYEKFLRLKRTA